MHYQKQWVELKMGDWARCSLLLFSHTQSFPHSFLSQRTGKRCFLTVFTEKWKNYKARLLFFMWPAGKSTNGSCKCFLSRLVEPKSFQGNHHPIGCSWKWYSVSMILISVGSQIEVWLTHVNLPVFNGWKTVKCWNHPIIPFHRHRTARPRVSESPRAYEY